MNLRPSGYEPDELPDCSTPRGLAAGRRRRRRGREARREPVWAAPRAGAFAAGHFAPAPAPPRSAGLAATYSSAP